MARFVFLILTYWDVQDALSSDGIPIRAGDDMDGEDELQYEWNTEGEREIEPERDSPDQVDQVFIFLLVEHLYWITQELLPVHLDHGQRVEEVAEELQESDLEEEPVAGIIPSLLIIFSSS